jgi:hypothetical protein
MAFWINFCYPLRMNDVMIAVLKALEMDPKPVPEIARNARVKEHEAARALEQLTAHNLAIAEEDGYELSGPLSWFGSFDAAVRYHARKRFVVAVAGDAQTHLYIDEVRVKGRRKAGDPENETVSVMACGRTSMDVTPAFDQKSPGCEACLGALEKASLQ